MVLIEEFFVLIAIKTISTIRIYIGAEGLYSKYQKDAVIHIIRYAKTYDELDYLSFTKLIEVPSAILKARIELEKPEGDIKAACQALLEAKIDPNDVKDMAYFYRLSNYIKTSYIEKVKELLIKADLYNAELKRLDQAKSEFLRIVSHQLRTPMTILRWYAKALLRGDYGKLNKKQLEVANDIYQATLRQIKLIGSFLDVAHIEAGKITVRKEKGNIEELVNDVVSELKVLAEKMGIYLKVEKPKKEVPEFYFDYEKTREVLRNIVDNAIKYIEKGGATVGFKYDEKKKEVLVYVKDTGIGFSPEEKKKLFMKFSRLRNNKVNPWGSGLGLYICKRLIEVQGGKIWAESPGKGKGSTFYFTLPVKDN